jgi:hypothetical protein
MQALEQEQEQRRDGRIELIKGWGVLVTVVISIGLVAKKNPSPIGLSDDVPIPLRAMIVGGVTIAAIVFLVGCRGASGISWLMDCAAGAAARSATLFHSPAHREPAPLVVVDDATLFHTSRRESEPLLTGIEMPQHTAAPR